MSRTNGRTIRPHPRVTAVDRVKKSRWRRRPHRSDDEEQARFQMHFELILEGARRANRPFSLSRFTFASREDAARFHQMCVESTRLCDAVQLDGSEALVIWDATPMAPAARAARRLKARGDTLLSAVCTVSTVSYPHAGYTPAALTRSLLLAPPDLGSVGTPATEAPPVTLRRNTDRLAG